MKFLIADDNLHSRMLLAKLLSFYGHCDTVVNGKEALEFFEYAIEEGEPYHLVCLNLMMPGMDGQEAMKRMRQFESEHGPDGVMNTAIFMTSALDTETRVVEAFFQGGCTDYLSNPITHGKLLDKMREQRLVLDLPGL
jgi:two-component system chemotaxis response regulator CheY